MTSKMDRAVAFDTLLEKKLELEAALAHQQKLVRVLAEEVARIGKAYDSDDMVAWAEAKVREQEAKP